MKRGDKLLACLGLLLLPSAADAGAASSDLDLSTPLMAGYLESPGFQAGQPWRESFVDGDRPCPEGDCDSPRSAPFGSDSGDGKKPGDAAGYYLLAAIPVIVGAGTLGGADHRLAYDDAGIWKRRNQLGLEYAVILTEVGGGLWEGGDTRLGRTYWESIDATVFSALAAQALKYSTGRERPSQSASPDHWRSGGSSFPSGEVALQAGFITPIIAEYAQDDPWVWGLEALPSYDGIARMKTWGHWQSDVLSGWALGTAFGIFAHNREMPFVLGYMPHGVMVGWHMAF